MAGNITNVTNQCPKPWSAVSNGAWQGDNPIHYALPLLIIQVSLVLAVTRSLALLLKPLKQPRVIAEIIGGVLLGPSALGHNKHYLKSIFPSESLTILDTVATLGLLFFLFMVGLELDLNEIRRTGKNSFIIAIAGICVPFVAGVGVASLMNETISKGTDFATLVVFMGVPLSITAFPVLVRILAERKLLTTDVGQLVLPAAAINDVCAWILLALGVALSGPKTSPATPVWVLLCGIAFVVFMLTVARRFMSWIAHRSSPQESVSEIYVCITLVGVLISGFITDTIGVHPLFGAFVFGLIIPKEGTFAQMLIEKIEDFVTVLLLPLFFASSGLKTNLGTIDSVRSFGYLLLLLATAGTGKIFATFVVGTAQGMPKRKALTLGVLMDTKGLVELIVLNIGKDLKVLDDQTFAILILMCLITTFIITPVVIALYKPARKHVPYTNRKLENSSPKDGLRILACTHGARSVPAIINLLEASRGTRKAFMKAYIMHLIELSERPSAVMIASRTGKHGYPRIKGSRASDKDHIFLAFEAYGQLSKVAVRPMTAISGLADMHEDICHTAAEKRTVLIVLPFHKYQRGDGELEVVNPGFRTVNQRVLQHAPCSVAILVDKGLGGTVLLPSSTLSNRIALLFFGGPDDREALALGCRLAEHPGVTLTVFRFLPGTELDHVVINLVPRTCASPAPASGELKSAPSDAYRFSTATLDVDSERLLDQECLAAALAQQGTAEAPDNPAAARSTFYQDCLAPAVQDGDQDPEPQNTPTTSRPIFYHEQIIDNAIDAAVAIGKSNEFNLLLVGRGRYPTPLIANLADSRPAECPELGPIGDALACSSGAKEMRSSVLVIQQYDPRLPQEAASTKVVENVPTLH
eukprot:c28186_g2_i2 orf=286-2889(-)